MSRRGRGDGTIRQRSNGIWEAKLRYKDPITGFAERLSLYATTRADVVAKLDAARLRLRGRASPRDEKIALADFLELWLRDVVRPTKRAWTYRSYKAIVDNHIASSRLGEIALRDLRAVQSDVDRGTRFNFTLQSGKIVKAAIPRDTPGFVTVLKAGQLAPLRNEQREFRGEIVAVGDDFVVQRAEDGVLFAHDRDLFSRTPPNVGAQLLIQYWPTQRRIDVHDISWQQSGLEIADEFAPDISADL